MERPGRGPQAPKANQGQDYGCKFCTKTFPNRQALGGHQNAHKVQRTMEKRARELRDNNHFGFYAGGGPVAYPGLYPGAYTRSHDFVDGSVYNPVQPHGMRVAGNPYGPARPVPGFNDAYSGWAAPGPRNTVPQCPGHVVSHVSHVQTRPLNAVFPNNGMGGSGSGSGSGSGLAAPRIRPGGTPGREIRDRANNPGNDQQGEDDESGLDLTLKL